MVPMVQIITCFFPVLRIFLPQIFVINRCYFLSAVGLALENLPWFKPSLLFLIYQPGLKMRQMRSAVLNLQEVLDSINV